MPSLGSCSSTAHVRRVARLRTVMEDVRKTCAPVASERRGEIEQCLALGQQIYELRTEAGLSQRELAARMDTTQSVISRHEDGGGARNRIDTLARVAVALGRHLVLSFPEPVPTEMKEAVQVA
ncbi:MAG: helix-turn-helix transcriptional regulator [Propionicimonas sp.]